MKEKLLKKRDSGIATLLIFGVFGLILIACQPKSLPTPTIVPARTCTLSPGETIPLAVTGVEGEVNYEWSTSGGTITPPTGDAVNFTAPENTNQVIIKVTASKDGATSESTIVCNIEIMPTSTPTATTTPPPTDTPIPTPTPSPIPTPLPIACNHPSITGYVFPQLKDVDGQFPFYSDTLSSDVFVCQGVYDRFRSEPLAVKIQYTAGVPAGYWGIATPKEKGYDAVTPGFTKVCFWAYAEQADQAFYLKIKDRQGRERQAEPPININITEPNKWVESCTPLSKFSDQGVNLSQIENINLGFSESTGSAAVWVDDFELK